MHTHTHTHTHTHHSIPLTYFFLRQVADDAAFTPGAALPIVINVTTDNPAHAVNTVVLITLSSADLAIAVASNATGGTLAPGAITTLNITVTNNGPDDASAINITALLPGTAELLAASIVSANAHLEVYHRGARVWSIAALALAQSSTLRLTLRAPTTPLNLAMLFGANSTHVREGDANPANNRAALELVLAQPPSVAPTAVPSATPTLAASSTPTPPTAAPNVVPSAVPTPNSSMAPRVDLVIGVVCNNTRPLPGKAVFFNVTVVNEGRKSGIGVKIVSNFASLSGLTGATKCAYVAQNGTDVGENSEWAMGSLAAKGVVSLQLCATVEEERYIGASTSGLELSVIVRH